jgi:hypothetical protein
MVNEAYSGVGAGTSFIRDSSDDLSSGFSARQVSKFMQSFGGCWLRRSKSWMPDIVLFS